MFRFSNLGTDIEFQYFTNRLFALFNTLNFGISWMKFTLKPLVTEINGISVISTAIL